MSEVEAVDGAAPGVKRTGDALREAEEHWATSFGGGSRRELARAFARRLEVLNRLGSAAASDFASMRGDVERAHRIRYGVEALRREACDERERDAARTSDRALLLYEKKWTKRLAKLQRAHPSRWCVPGLSDEEVRDELGLRLLEALRGEPEMFVRAERAGREWGLSFLCEELRALRKRFRVKVVLTEPSPSFGRAPSGEEQLIVEQSERAFAISRERAEARLSRSQRRWFAAMLQSANAGGFFEASGKLNLAAVSRELDKNRSSALRAFSELRVHFSSELKKIEG